jgi:hypothetical protein
VLRRFFHGRKPTQREYEECMRYELTYPDPEWCPNSKEFAKEESWYVEQDRTLGDLDRHVLQYTTHDDERFLCELNSSEGEVEVDATVDVAGISSKPHRMSPEALSRNWCIGKSAAAKTIKITTQKGVRTIAYPNIERRWPTGNCPLWYRKLHHQVYHDTLYAKITSLRGNNCSEIYATDFG